MRCFLPLTLTTLLGAASLSSAFAGTLRVPSTKYPTIQKALNAAKPGDTVLVSAKPKGAVYNEALTLKTANVVLQGQNNPVIDGTGLGTVVTPPYPFQPYTVVPNGIEIRASHVAVRGLTVQNFGGGNNALSPASGINVGYSSVDSRTDYSFSDIEISGCTLQDNYDGLTISGFAGPNPFYGSGGGYLSGYKLLSNTVTGNTDVGLTISGLAVQVTGNHVLANGGDGADAYGDGLTISGNEIGSNGYYGLFVSNTTYNPAAGTTANPNPAPTVVTRNAIHDNTGYGISVNGTEAVTGNIVSRNNGYGIYLYYADYSVVSANAVTATTSNYGDGTGIYADYDAYDAPGSLTVSLNQVSGNAGDGIGLNAIAGALVTGNAVTANQGVGIHLSDYTSFGYAPNTVSYNVGLRNVLFDAKDDASAPDYDASTTVNVWTKNTFGTTDPVGLSK